MPPKSASKPTSQAESDFQSGEAQHGTSDSYLPVVLAGNPMLPDQVQKAVGIFYWYKFQGRPMTRDEVQGMLSFKYGKNTNGRYLNNQFKTLEKQVEKSGATDYEREIKKLKIDPKRISAEVDAVYNDYCDTDEDAQDRRDNLNELKMRLPHLELGWRPEWAGKPIRTDQLCCLYGLTNWCKTDEHLPLPEGLVVEIATKFIFHDKPPPGKYSGLISNLKEPEHQLASQLHDILESHQDIKFYFRDKAFRFHNQHEGREITDLARDALTSTTAGLSGLTVTAGASGEEWSSMHDFDTTSASAGSSEAGPSSRPNQITTINRRLLDKRKERESTESSSPASGADPSEGTIGSEAKGKAPQSKRPRGSG